MTNMKSKAAEYNKARYSRMIAEGLCVVCSQPRDGKSKWRCKACLRKLADAQKARAIRRAYYYKPNEPDESPASS